MELRDLASFYEIYKAKKFSSAAEILHCTESTLSARIKNLEAEVGARLFERGPKGVTLSEEGYLLLPYVEKTLFLLREARQTLNEWSSCAKGSISIAASNYISCYQLPHILCSFKSAYPHVELNVHVGRSSDVINMVRNYEAQIGLSRSPLSDPLMTSIKISQDPLVLCVYPEHPLAHLPFVDLKDLENYPLISYQKGSDYWSFINNAFSTIGFTPTVFMKLDSMEATKKMVSKSPRHCPIAPAGHPRRTGSRHASGNKNIKPTGALPGYIRFFQQKQASFRSFKRFPQDR